MPRRIVDWVDGVVFLALIVLGILTAMCRPWNLDASGTGSLAGALFGAAAVLLGSWINRLNTHYRSESELESYRTKLKTLIAGELVDVAAGLLSAKKLIDSALVSINAQGDPVNFPDMTRYRPRALALTDSLATDCRSRPAGSSQ